MEKTPRKRRTLKPPKYCLHKASGRAYVHLDGADHYFGDYGSDESRKAYSKLISEHSAGAIIESGRAITTGDGITVVELVSRYLKYAQGYYVKNGKMTDEVSCIKSAVRPLIELYGISLSVSLAPWR